jgi:hypothetical protein
MGKSSPKAPAAPDANALISAQSSANKDAITQAARVNAVDIYGPYGQTTYQRDADGLPTAQYTSLNPSDQATLDKQRQIAGDLTGKAQQAVGWLPTSTLDYSGIGYDPANVDTSQLRSFNPASYTPQTMSAQNYQMQQFGGAQGNAPGQLNGGNYQLQQLNSPGQGPQSQSIWGQGQGQANLPYDPRNYGDVSQISQTAADSVYNAGKARLEPQFQQQQDDMMQMLSDRGIPIDSAAAHTVMSNMARDQSDAYGRLANDSYMAGHQVAGDNISREQSLRTAGLGEQSMSRDWANQDFMRDYSISSDVNQRNNQTSQNQFAIDSGLYGMGDAAYQRDFGMDLQTNQTRNQNTASQFGIDSSIHDQQNADYMLGFNNDLTTVNQNNQDWLTRLQTEQGLRSQQIGERTTLRNSAINDVSMYLQGAPAFQSPTAPQVPVYQQQAVNAMNAYLASYGAQMNAYDAAQQNRTSIWNSAGQIGQAAMSLWSSKRLKDTLGDASVFLRRVAAMQQAAA